MGDFEAFLLGNVESPMKYHPYIVQFLTLVRTTRGPCVAGSFGGALSLTRSVQSDQSIENRKNKIWGTVVSNYYKQFG